LPYQSHFGRRHLHSFPTRRSSDLTKILAIVILMAGVAGTISWFAIDALATVAEGAALMKSAANRALLAARANQNVIALNRAEFRAALDPRNENRERSEEHTSELQSRFDLVCRLLLEKKNKYSTQ